MPPESQITNDPFETPFDNAPRTKREALLMRAAYARAFGDNAEAVRTRAKELFPIPTRRIERPRVGRYLEYEYRIAEGTVQIRDARKIDNAWGPYLQSDWFRFLQDLLRNPTELVEVEVDE